MTATTTTTQKQLDISVLGSSKEQKCEESCNVGLFTNVRSPFQEATNASALKTAAKTASLSETPSHLGNIGGYIGQMEKISKYSSGYLFTLDNIEPYKSRNGKVYYRVFGAVLHTFFGEERKSIQIVKSTKPPKQIKLGQKALIAVRGEIIDAFEKPDDHLPPESYFFPIWWSIAQAPTGPGPGGTPDTPDNPKNPPVGNEPTTPPEMEEPTLPPGGSNPGDSGSPGGSNPGENPGVEPPIYSDPVLAACHGDENCIKMIEKAREDQGDDAGDGSDDDTGIPIPQPDDAPETDTGDSGIWL